MPPELQDENIQESNVVETQEPSWMLDANTAGVGDRPEWLPEKFKTVADGFKSYNELEKVLGSAPKEYNFEKGQGWFESDHPAMKGLAEAAKSKHISQDAFDAILDSTTQYLNEFSVDIDKERAELGENAEERIQVIDNWAKSNLSEDAFYALTENMNTAKSVMALEEIRNLMMNNNTMIPNGNDADQNNSESIEEIQMDMNSNFDKYQSDAKYRKEISARIERASKNSSFIDKRS